MILVITIVVVFICYYTLFPAVSLENDAEKQSSDVASMTYKLKTPTAIEVR